MNNYYVYEWIRLDTNEPFYVGKGKGDRWKQIGEHHRNKHFMNILKKYDVTVVIEKNNLTEQEAFYWEEKIIETLVFEYGFSINIPNNRSNNSYCHLVNSTWGGEGSSGYKHTEETKKKMRENHWDCSGENNYWYGKTLPREIVEKNGC